jgi:anti-sigma factor RsiW
MDCKQKDNLVAYLDGELMPSEAEAVREHLVYCADCRAQLDLLRRSYTALDHIEDVEAPAGLAAKVRARTRSRRLPVVFGTLAVAAAALFLFTVQLNRPVVVEKPVPSGANIVAAGDDVTADAMDVLETIDLVDDSDVMDELDVFAELEAMEDSGAFGSDATI